jgi:hypothetical protein
MPKFYVTMEETVHYTVEVEAANATEAETLGAELWAASEDPTHDFCSSGLGAEARQRRRS